MTVLVSDQAYYTKIWNSFFFLLATAKVAPLSFTLLGRFSLFILPRSKGASKFSISGIFLKSLIVLIYFLFSRHKNSTEGVH
jgi:hypothetical protein